MEAALWPYGKCEKCGNKNYCSWSQTEILNCMNNGYCNFSPMTNADSIRGMTDEELAETYAGGCPNGDRLNCGKYYLHGGRDCFNCWLDWLKAPVEVQDGCID